VRANRRHSPLDPTKSINYNENLPRPRGLNVQFKRAASSIRPNNTESPLACSPLSGCSWPFIAELGTQVRQGCLVPAQPNNRGRIGSGRWLDVKPEQGTEARIEETVVEGDPIWLSLCLAGRWLGCTCRRAQRTYRTCRSVSGCWRHARSAVVSGHKKAPTGSGRPAAQSPPA